MTSARYEVVLMDADDTLFDFGAAEKQAFFRTMDAFHLPHTEGDYMLYHTINEALWRALERGEATQERLRTERFGRLFSRLDLRVDCAAFNRNYLRALGDGHFTIPGARELCAALHGQCALYIVTNGIGATQRKRLAASGLEAYFNDVFISEELGAHKPEPAYFDAAFARIGLKERHHAILLGDSLTSDMLGGKNAGIATCWYNPGGAACARPELCDFTIAALEDFPTVLGL